MLDGVIAFISYLGCAIVLLLLFIVIYIRVTPYREFELIAKENSAAAVTLAGAVLGFTFPVVASIYYTRSLLEMAAWAAITCVVQLGVFIVLRSQASRIEQGNMAAAIMVATFSVAIGLLNAVSISH